MRQTWTIKLKTALGIISLLVLLAACTTSTGSDTSSTKITVYKDASCGCCGGYASYLKQNGFDVEVVIAPDIDAFKKEKGVPDDLRSCHTAIAGNYVIEGHVPVEAIQKLLAEQPSIKGIALPGMPAGSPGMGGTKNKPFTVYQIADGTPVFAEV